MSMSRMTSSVVGAYPLTYGVEAFVSVSVGVGVGVDCI